MKKRKTLLQKNSQKSRKNGKEKKNERKEKKGKEKDQKRKKEKGTKNSLLISSFFCSLVETKRKFQERKIKN